MSSAFVKEDPEEQQWLHEVKVTVAALEAYLTKENYGVRVFEKTSFTDGVLQKRVHVMSNGLQYTKDEEGRWYVI